MKFTGWDKIAIQADDGAMHDGIAPLIISASRSTDIPAFHSSWLAERLRRGYVKWVNPFNQAAQYVSFAKARLFVFWSKNPEPLISHLDEFDRRGLHYYFQFTVNDYEREGLEPHVPPLPARLNTFRRLASRIGRDRVIWRFDPLILMDDLTVASLAEKVKRVGDQLADATRKLVISFADVSEYAKVRNHLRREQQAWREFSEVERDEVAGSIAMLAKGWGIDVATCAEEFDLSTHGILPNRCIDDELIIRLFQDDSVLMDFLGVRTPSPRQKTLFSSSSTAPSPLDLSPAHSSLKDKGQRKACGCIVSKDIGQYNTCGHLCLYCYANTSDRAVRKNLNRLNPYGDSICASANEAP